MGSSKGDELYNGEKDILITITSDFEFRGLEREAMQAFRTQLFTQTDMNEIGQIIVNDIKDGINKGSDLKENPFIPNTKKWIKRKGNSTVFKGKTNKLYNSVRITEVTDNSVSVSATGGGLWWQIKPGNQTGALPYYQRDFFGISIRAFRKLEEFMRKRFG